MKSNTCSSNPGTIRLEDATTTSDSRETQSVDSCKAGVSHNESMTHIVGRLLNAQLQIAEKDQPLFDLLAACR